jgi:cyanophycin synthetase
MPLKKIGIIAGIGDRRDEDIRECATIARECLIISLFDRRKYLRGRTEEEIINLILEGIASSGQDVTYEIIPKETEAIKHAIKFAEEGSFITCLSDGY